MNRAFFTVVVAAIACVVSIGSAHAQLYFTQYYEGPSTNKWLEITNTGSVTIDLSTYAVGHWNNANAEGYKTGVAPSFTFTLTGTLTAGQSLILGNTGNATPAYLSSYSPRLNNNAVINFNGNDSVGLYTAGTYSTSVLIDAIGFTNAGNEGVDRSFVRTSLSPGYNLTSGSTVVTFSSIWTNTLLTTVDGAAAGTDARLGFSSLAAVPEPQTYGLALAGMLVVLVVARRRKTLQA